MDPKEPLFPVLPEDLSALDREALTDLEAEHLAAQQMIRENNRDFLSGLNTTQIVEQARLGKQQLALIRESLSALDAAEATYLDVIAELTSEAAETETADEPAAEAELAAEVEEPEETVEETVVEPVEEPVVASAEIVMRRPAPQPTRERLAVIPEDTPKGAVLLASASSDGVRVGDELDPSRLSRMLLSTARRLGRPTHSEYGKEERYYLAAAAFPFPEERILTGDINSNTEKIMMLRNEEGNSLVASGGFCAPLENIYTIPQFATRARPVRDALPSFQATRGGVNVPVPTTLASALDAITVITAAEDALGGTFATKACLDQTCLDFDEYAVTIISHCREYGNLNARAWPESVTFENDLTMAEHARVADGYLLNRLRGLSLKVTAADVYSTTYDLIYALTRAAESIRYNLRMPSDTRFRALLPTWIVGNMISDIAATPFDRFVDRARVIGILRNAGVDPAFYIDDLFPQVGVSQGFPAEVDGTTIDNFPTAAQIGMWPEGAFIHLDGGVLELGLVRDSTLNSTNDFQFFGETFEDVARLAPVQATRWITATICPSGEFPSTVSGASVCS